MKFSQHNDTHFYCEIFQKNNGQDKESVPRQKSTNYVASTIPLTLHDVAYINMTDDNFKTIYGLSFNTIMVYGCVRFFRQTQNFTQYHIDDGTGCIFVKYFNQNKTAIGKSFCFSFI